MLKLGIALPQSVDGVGLLAAVDEFSSRAATPDIVAVWSSLSGGYSQRGLSLDVLRQLDHRGIEPMVFLESDAVPAGAPTLGRYDYATIIGGAHDDILRRIAIVLRLFRRPVIVRWDQEPNAAWERPWALSDPTTYVAAFSHVSTIITGIAPNARLFYCPTWRGRGHEDDFERYYPGEACAVVGFDSYVRAADPPPIARRWDRAIDALRAFTDKPVVVGEFALAAGSGDRAAWLRSLGDVTDVEAAVYFDLDRSEQEGVDWRLDEDMEGAWRGLTR